MKIVRLMFDYMAQLEVMIQSNRSTLYVDFQHLMEVFLFSALHNKFHLFMLDG